MGVWCDRFGSCRSLIEGSRPVNWVFSRIQITERRELVQRQYIAARSRRNRRRRHGRAGRRWCSRGDCRHCRRMGQQMPAVRDPLVAVEGLGHDPPPRYQHRPGPPTTRMAETQMVVYQHILQAQVVHRGDSGDPGPGANDGAGQVGNGLGSARRRSVGGRGRDRLRLHMEYLS